MNNDNAIRTSTASRLDDPRDLPGGRKPLRRLLIVLTTVALLALLAALAGPAAARKGGKPPKPDSQVGGTCQGLVDNGAIWALGTWVADGDTQHSELPHYDANIEPGHGAICIDLSGAEHPAGDWIIDWEIITPPPEPHVINSILFEIKDSHPGDICWLAEVDSPLAVDSLIAADLSDSVEDACGTSWSDEGHPELAFLTILDIHRLNQLLRKPFDLLIEVTLIPPV